MEANAWGKRAAIAIVVLAILVGGVYITCRVTTSPPKTPRVVYKLPEKQDSNQRKALLDQGARYQWKRVGKLAAEPNDYRGVNDPVHSSTAPDTLETEETWDNSAPKIWPEANQNDRQINYDKTYDTLIGVTMEMATLLAEIKRIDEEIKEVVGEWKRNVRDPKNPTEEEERLGREMKEETRPLAEEREQLDGSLNSFVNEIATAVPGAIQTESFGAYKSRVSIDYGHIRSSLGAPPEEYDAHLTAFFATFARWMK